MVERKIERVVIAVRELETGMEFFGFLLDTTFRKLPELKGMGVRAAVSPSGIELLAPTTPDSEVGKFIARQGEGVFMVSFRAHDLESARTELASRGLKPFYEVEPVEGMKEVQFHPRDTFGVLVQLAEYPGDGLSFVIGQAESDG